MRKPAGRADQAPPTDEELSRLLDGCSVHGDYGYRLRAMLTFCAFSGVRPGEAMALGWADVNLPPLRVHVSKRLYRGTLDLPKSNQGPDDRSDPARPRRSPDAPRARGAGVQ